MAYAFNFDPASSGWRLTLYNVVVIYIIAIYITKQRNKTGNGMPKMFPIK